MNQDAFRTIGEVLDALAAQRPNDIAIISVSRTGGRRTLTFSQLNEASNKAASLLWDINKGKSFLGVVELTNCSEHFVWAIGIWKAGGCYVPLSHKLADKDRVAVYEQIKPAVVVSEHGEEGFGTTKWLGRCEYETVSSAHRHFDDAEPAIPCKAILTAGTTGMPKAVYQNSPMVMSERGMQEWFAMSGQQYGQTQLLLGPLGHGSAGSSAFMGVMAGHKMVILEKFNADQAVELIQEYDVQAAVMVPTMMKRIMDVVDREHVTFPAFEALCHTGSFCPQDLKRKWIDLIGAEHIFEIYSMSEAIGMTLIRGDEWLQHPGSVGRPFNCDIEIRDSEGAVLPAGSVGEIFMRPGGSIVMKSVDLERAAARGQTDGFYTVGDLGYLSEENYLYFADRRTDMIVTGGMNVFACEVEQALFANPWIVEAAVIGIPDSDWGQKVCAYIVLSEDAPLVGEAVDDYLRTQLKKSLDSYKIPKEYRVVDSLPKNDAGKILRARLREQVK